MENSTVVRLAADLMQTKGFTTGTFRDDKGGYCMMGAINEIIHQKPFSIHNFTDVLNRVFKRLYGCSMPTFNDSATKETAVAMLYEFADRLEQVEKQKDKS